MWGLAFKSLRNRRFTALLTILSIALSVALLLGVQRLREESRHSFASTISGTDLIVGARSSPVHLLLASVFRIGSPTNAFGWESYEAIAAQPAVDWAVPVAMGDNHAGFAVVGTTTAFFKHFRYAADRRLDVAQGSIFDGAYEAVVGADVAGLLGYEVGQSIVNAHGAGDVSFQKHTADPFRITGILARTGTPVDRAVYVSLEGFDAIHADLQRGAEAHDPLGGHVEAADDDHGAEVGHHEAGPERISAILIGLKSRGAALQMQRFVNEYRGEPLTAILPGATLLELWSITGVAERALMAVAVFVVAVGLIGMLTALLTNLEERRREMAILRSVGARPLHVLGLITGEALVLTVAGAVAGLAVLYALLLAFAPLLETRFGLFVAIGWPTAGEFAFLGALALLGFIVGLIPGYRIYRFTLVDGMTVRL
jgi:putative ABC transport system permease protein